MGLDITAYSNLTKIDNPVLDEDGYPDCDSNQWRARSLDLSDKNFPGRSAGLENDAVYEYEASMGFRAGSYSGYNQWRSELAKLVGFADANDLWDACKSGPFWELINFYDNEGTIGPIVSAKLAKDFAEHREAAEAVGGYFFEKYCEWQEAFEMAAQNGAVDFH